MLMKNLNHPLYHAMLGANADFEATIKKVCGPHATRENCSDPRHPEILAAHKARRIAEHQWRAHQKFGPRPSTPEVKS